MAKLENITVGSSVKGIAGNEAVTIVAVQWYGTNVIDITYRNSQNVSGQQLLYREDESRIEVMDKNLPWSFDANGDNSSWHPKHTESASPICLTRISPYIRPLWNLYRTRFLRYIRKCYRDSRCAMFWRTTPVPVKQL